MSLERKAADFAENAHGDQLYGTSVPYTSEPYTYHLSKVHREVCRGIRRKPTSPEKTLVLMQAAWLHDVLEDTETTKTELSEQFGQEVADLVDAVTNDVPGNTRRERSQGYYAKIVRGGPDALFLKLADRIANVKHCWKTRSPLLFMYHKEYGDFRKALKGQYAGLRIDRAWSELDALMGWNA
jgi:(p)ppGpp synthase/HD superfamily hydrolase